MSYIQVSVYTGYLYTVNNRQEHAILDDQFWFLLLFFVEYSFTPLPMLIYRSIGGVLDFYLFMGPTPEGVVYDYTTVSVLDWLSLVYGVKCHLAVSFIGGGNAIDVGILFPVWNVVEHALFIVNDAYDNKLFDGTCCCQFVLILVYY